MKSISLFLLLMALSSIFGGLVLWAFGMPKIIAIIMSSYGCILMVIHVIMNDRIESVELEIRNRQLYK